MPQATLPEAIRGEVGRLGQADIIVGIPSFKSAATIGYVVRAAHAGLVQYFPDLRPVIVNSDAGSPDGTQRVVIETEPPDYVESILLVRPRNRLQRITLTYPEVEGVGGKGAALRSIFEIARALEAQALVVVDSDLRSIGPEWIELLAGPILKGGFDFVAPLYARYKWDGTITNTVTYPLTRALYGLRIRQPIGGDFGFSGRLATHYLPKAVWESNVARFGIDIWMTTTAIADGFSVCQAFLGAKIHDAKDPGADLAAMFEQVVASVFDLMRTYEACWTRVEGAEDVPLFGFPHGVGLEPVNVNVERMLGIFRSAVRDLAEVWRLAIPPQTLAEVTALGGADAPSFRFPDSLWVKLVCDFAVAYHRRALPSQQLLRSLVPLYLGRTASFVIQTADSDAEQVERIIRDLADEYVRQKPYLHRRWTRREPEEA